MGQYRFSVYAHLQLGVLIKIDKYSLDIHIPFITAHIALTKNAKGIEVFGFYFTIKKNER